MDGRRYSLRTLLVLTAIGCVILGAIAWVNNRMNSFFDAVVVGNSGPVTSPEEWPSALKTLAESASEESIELNGLHVHCLASGMAIEYIWRMDTTPGMFKLMKKKFRLTPSAKPPGDLFVRQPELPKWWNPLVSDSTEYFAARSSLDDVYCVLHDEEHELLYVYYSEDW
jgi:hypothetical protein